MIKIVNFQDKYFNEMVECYDRGFPQGYNRYALSRLVRFQKDTIFIAVDQKTVVGVLVGITNSREAWFSGLTTLPGIENSQRCIFELTKAVADRFIALGFTKGYFTTERRSILKLAKLVQAENIVEKPNFYFDGAKRWVVTVNPDSFPKLLRMISN